MSDLYNNFEELKADNEYGVDYTVIHEFNDQSDLIIVAPHGENIEPLTSELTTETSKNISSSYYIFGGIRSKNNFELHITSANFDEPTALSQMNAVDYALSYHGYAGDDPNTIIGGLDEELAMSVLDSLQSHGFSAEKATSKFTATNPNNIVNRTKTGMGVQLELSAAQRKLFTESGEMNRKSRQSLTEEFYRYVESVKKGLASVIEQRV
ncbi:poly-gamma-glutamate hydrolase [Bacillus phage vB_BauM_KLEB27-3]|nr:poly-gamma-glutamate hydrolase [Bacillus phage vB_BauM_KLEB27-3]